ncbi:glycoside hydrolase family 43 protein [Terracidiphilus gabretensis]|uniref:glycoside hydrolase family 43 protein n=1 Tax=Terracidiphilus gabretensis TaxID=1577687 RepID=UPI00071B4F6A|nr:glycoside hydrolase 43 family protein [Terracidiphilus gabretensis]
MTHHHPTPRHPKRSKAPALSLVPCLFLLFTTLVHTQTPYNNPILYADYSDPDAIRYGSHYYLIASTFHFVPGIPILSSTDLVHWTIAAHAVQRLNMDPRYNLTGSGPSGNRYGMGIWAPAIRRHNGLFYIYFPTPTEGIFVTTAHNITGPWTEPTAVIAQPGLEDPCPFWDDDGQAYLVHSRKGAGPLILHHLSPDGLHVLDEGKVIVDDHQNLPTLEGPKLYKRNGWYYIFAPFGGVTTGKQAVLRSHSIYGPYEQRVVLAQGSTKINGPHQGAYIETPSGQGFFLHFQSAGAHGRIVHLEPVTWQNDWPIIGAAGEPVPSGTAPKPAEASRALRPQTSDEFSTHTLGQQWEWNHNPDNAHWSLTARPGYLRLIPAQAEGLLTAHNTLTQCMQDNAFDFTTRIDISALKPGTHAGLAMFEASASGLEIIADATQKHLQYFHQTGPTASTIPGPALTQPTLQLRIHVEADTATYFYSLDNGKAFQSLGPPTPIHFSWWKGSRPSLFAYTTEATAGTIDFDWAHYTQTAPNPW